MRREYAIITDALNRHLKVYPIIECFDKQTEILIEEIPLYVKDMNLLKRWLENYFMWKSDQPLIGSVNLSKKSYLKMLTFVKKDCILNLDFEKYDYQLSFEYEEIN